MSPDLPPSDSPPPAMFAGVVFVLRWLLLGSAVGVLAGLSSAGFLVSLEWATDTRVEHGWLLWLLPIAGMAAGWVYYRFAGQAAGGNNLILDEIHTSRGWIPRRMAPLVYAATIVTHLFGGSAGREGTAIQMSGSLADGVVGRLVRFDERERKLLLIAAISGGFGAVFGVPIAGFVFGLEVHARGKIRHDAMVGALAASVVGDQVVRMLGVSHTILPHVESVVYSPALFAKIAVAGVAFGAAAWVFSELTHAIKHGFNHYVGWPPLRPLLGGVAVILLTLAVGTRAYLGLSVPLIVAATDVTVGVAAFAFAWKILFTAITLGAGYQGGEVTPLFVIGATLGASLGDLMDGPVLLFAAMGFVAVFAGATNTPLACTIMGIETFGGTAVMPFAVACVIAYLVSGPSGIYASQRVGDATVGEWRSGWQQRFHRRPRVQPGK